MSSLKFMCISLTAGLLLSACATKADPNRKLGAEIADLLELTQEIEEKRQYRTSSRYKCSLAEQDEVKDYSEWPTHRLSEAALKGRRVAQYEFARRLETGDRVPVDLSYALTVYGEAMKASHKRGLAARPQNSGYGGAQASSGTGPSSSRCSPVEAEAIEGVKRVVEKIYDAGLVPRE